MGWWNHCFDDHFEVKTECPKCGKKFRYCYQDQVPGFRMKDELYCPYCKEELERSMEIEFFGVEKLEDD